jgi:threonyl-tRNA synthetase
VAFADKKQLDAYLMMVEEAEKRDHRKIGRELKLFHIQEEAVGPGFLAPCRLDPLPDAAELHREKAAATTAMFRLKHRYLVDRKLWEASGHWEKFRESDVHQRKSMKKEHWR